MKKQILNSKGTGYIDVSVSILIISLFLLLSISVFTIVSNKITLDRITDNIAYETSLKGYVDDEIIDKIEKYKERLDLNFEYDFDCEYITGENKIQLGDSITFTISMNVSILGIYDMPLVSKSQKLSKVYFK